MNNVPSHTALASWLPEHGDREITVSDDTGPLAIIPLPSTGQPGRAELDYALNVLGFTRTGPWADTGSGLVADCEPIR
jgi:hypothetical protein